MPALASNLLLLQAFGLHAGTTWNGPSWSIAAEMWAYLLFAALIVASRKMHVGLIFAVSVTALIYLVVQNDDIDTTYDFGAARCFYGFGIGVLTYLLFQRVRPPGGHLIELLAIGTATCFVSFASGKWTFAAPVIFAAGIYGLSAGNGVVSKLLGMKLFQLLGLTSYSIYMLHAFLQARMMEIVQLLAPNLIKGSGGDTKIIGSALVGNVLTTLMVAGLVGLAWASYRLIEKPARQRVREWLQAREELIVRPNRQAPILDQDV